MMAKDPQRQPLIMMPWEGGLMLTGSPDIRHPSALQIAEDIVFDHSGAKMRRGGQVHLHRVPIREGTVLEDHFLDATLSAARWGTQSISANHYLSSYRKSVLHCAQVAGTTDGVTTLSNVTKGATYPANKMKYLVPTLSSDVLEAERQATTISIQWRMRGSGEPTDNYGWPDYSFGNSGEKYIGIEVEPGRPGDPETAEWHLDARFGGSATGMMIRNESGTMTLVSFDSGFTKSDLFFGGDFHTWRIDVKRNADSGGVRHYVCDIYFEETKVASDIAIDNDSVAGTAFAQLTFDSGATGSTMDVEFDSFDVQAEVQEVRGLFEFSEDPTDIEGATRKRAIYAGSRVYLDLGNHFDLQCIDDGLDKDQFCSFEVFESRIRPFRIDQLVSQQTSG